MKAYLGFLETSKLDIIKIIIIISVKTVLSYLIIK